MENTSGGGSGATVPAEIKRWNWGAFLLSWIWGIGNNTFIAFLMFVPLVNMAMPFVLGAKGSTWAWQNKRWESVEAFKATQRKWTLGGVVALGIFVVLMTGLFVSIIAVLKNSTAYEMAVKAVKANSEAVQILGQPITSSFPTGNIRVSGPDGEANLSFDVEGPQGKGTVYVRATEALGQWRLDLAVLENARNHQRIDITQADDHPARQ
ncbi:cytochrome c oxidase assembly factor Coa1 family protein [Dyella lutea]|uniref:Cytochrome c oxidase assembly factor 1 family protein n=1 Tax=Dyella lutea TaxID=2950441 RepID=A0ABT1FI42_9GAMM|nr:cytochrome c oxidase assembly factor Coa1 family protein [Dyella lutea]MCP1376093.1 cytochrome c oxidase assembly factor 1 family protein [Dyella lutea]